MNVSVGHNVIGKFEINFNSVLHAIKNEFIIQYFKANFLKNTFLK